MPHHQKEKVSSKGKNGIDKEGKRSDDLDDGEFLKLCSVPFTQGSSRKACFFNSSHNSGQNMM